MLIEGKVLIWVKEKKNPERKKMIQLSQYFYFHCSEILQDVNEFHFYFMLNFYALWFASLLNLFDTPITHPSV